MACCPAYSLLKPISLPPHSYKLAQIISTKEKNANFFPIIDTRIAIQAKNKRQFEQRRPC